jgi:hypothetical protein
MGRLNAVGRLAHFLVETERMLNAIGRMQNGHFAYQYRGNIGST